jgi:hypothetical protein
MNKLQGLTQRRGNPAVCKSALTRGGLEGPFLPAQLNCLMTIGVLVRAVRAC